MSNVAEIVSSFEKQLISIINSKEETEKSLQKTSKDFFAKYGNKDSKHKNFAQQPTSIKTGVNLEINPDELADEVHKKICELIKQKAYPVNEVDWFRFLNTNTWHFGFAY